MLYKQKNGIWLCLCENENGDKLEYIVTDKQNIKQLNDIHRKQKLSKLLS